MAESYRGLTIRIGGDTTKLTQALHTANQAISGTQSSMKKLSDALKMDPSSLRASQLQVGAFAEQASNAAARLVTLNDAMRQIGDEVKSFHGASATVNEMANSWGNVSMKASQARDYYSALTKTIATNYTELSKLHAEAAKSAGANMAEKLSDSFKKMDFESVIKGVTEINSTFGRSSNNLNGLLSRLEEMKERYSELTDEAQEYKDAISAFEKNGFDAVAYHGEADNHDYTLLKMNTTLAEAADEARKSLPVVGAELEKLREQFRATVSEISGFKGIGTVFKFENDNVDLTSLARGLKEIVEQGQMSVEEADELMLKYIKLKDVFDQAFNDVKTANAVEGFRDLEAETAKAEAKMKSLVNEMVRLAQVTETKRGLVVLQQQLDDLSAKSEQTKGRLNGLLASITESMKLNGGNANEGLVKGAMQEYATIVELTQQKIANLQEQISHYTDEEVIALANSTKSLAADTEEATEKFSEQQAILIGYQAGLDDLQIKMDKIAASDPIGNNNTEAIEQYKEYYKQWFDINNAMQQAKKSASEAQAEMAKFVDATDLREKNQQLAQEEHTLERVSKINFKPEVDISSVEGLRKAVEAINNGLYDAKGSNKFGDIWDFSKAAENIRIANAALDAARNKFKELSTATKNDPTNSATMAAAMQAAQQYADKLEASIQAYRDQIDSIPADKIDQVALATGKVTEKFETAKAKVDEFDKKIKDTEAQIKALTEEKKGIVPDDDGKKQIDDINARIKTLRQNLKELQEQADVALDEFATADNTRRIDEAQTKARTLRGELSKVKEEARKLGETTATPKIDEAAFIQVVDRIAQAARRMGSEIVQASNEIDEAYRNMRKTVQGTETDFENLRDAAIEYSQSSITSADSMLNMQALGGQLGIAVQNLEQFGRIASNLDIATDIDAETVALKLGQISNILQLDIDGMQGFSDALVRLGNNMPAQESAIMAVAQRFGAVATTANFSGDEVLAWSAAIAATGQRSEAAATAISNTVSGIEQAVANGGSDLKQFAAIASMSADEFVAAWKSSPTETLRAFIEGLKTLKDSDESAVAALENMGITGVRQQQTLLALTQTVESLDKALTMSSDAWNGINDQWGQSGDAANEAEKKAEGFSGALAILKNNAQNLAASFGDSLVPLLKNASEILEFVTDTFNNLPDPVKRTIVELGGLTVALSTIVPMLNVFNEGMIGIVEAAGEATSIGNFIARVTGFSAVTEAAAGSATALGTALSGPVVLGVAAAVSALIFAISKFNEYQEKQQTIVEATDGLASAMSDGKAKYDEYIQGAQGSAHSVLELRDALNEATEAQATYANEIRDAWDGISQSEAQVDMLTQKITELSLKGSLTAQEQQELNAAVKLFNSLTGESVRVIDAENGVLDASTGQIRDMGKAWKNSLEQDQLFDQYADEVAQITENEALLAEAEQKLKDSDLSSWFTDMRDGVSSTSEDYQSLKNDVDNYRSVLASLKQQHERTISEMDDVNNSLGEVEVALNSVGHSLTDYGHLTDEQCEQIIKAFEDAGSDSSKAIKDVMALLDEFQSGANSASEIARNLEETSKAAAKERAAAFKAQATAEYNETKRQLDSIYKAQQRSYNNAYNALKSQYDHEYKARKKGYDDAYKQLKDQLDKEYKAKKKAYDDQLAALKKSQDAEVAAFKKATEARLKEMKKEYEQRVKMLELQYGKSTDDIDERIDALKAETNAEKKAIEERNEADKIAELQSAVDKAKSRRSRAEAEKALNDYLQELEAERNEASRDAEIERLEDQKDMLKDELDARKEILKEEYDAEVEAYKEKRAAELEALQAANQVEYDALKDALDGQLQSLKDQQQERLDSLKEAQDEQLQALKDGQQAQLDAMKESQQEALNNLKQSQQKQLEDIKAANDAQYNQIKNGLDKESEAQKAHNEEALREQKEASDKIYRANDEANSRLFERTSRALTDMDKQFGHYGNAAPESLASGLNKGEDTVSRGANAVGAAVEEPIKALTRVSFTEGQGFTLNYASGIGSSLGLSYVANAARSVADVVFGYLHHSVPDKGPLANDDKWGGELVQNIIDGMRDKEHDLARQAERMARAMEDGFDPTLTVDAAYEALDTIGKNRSKSLGSIVETSSAPTVTINLSLNLDNVSVRSDADIEHLAKAVSQEMAAQATRQMAGRLG